MDNAISIFYEYLAKCNDFSESELDYIVSKMKYKRFAKRTFLLRAGEVCSFEAFVLKGLAISYFLDAEGSKVVLAFASENWWLSDIDSFQNGNESKMFIEFLEDSEVLILDVIDKEELLRNVPKLERMYRILVERHLINYQERIFGTIALSGREKYQLFLSKYHYLLQRLPQHLIASFLGITPEFLSRIRKDKTI